MYTKAWEFMLFPRVVIFEIKCFNITISLINYDLIVLNCFNISFPFPKTIINLLRPRKVNDIALIRLYDDAICACCHDLVTYAKQH